MTWVTKHGKKLYQVEDLAALSVRNKWTNKQDRNLETKNRESQYEEWSSPSFIPTISHVNLPTLWGHWERPTSVTHKYLRYILWENQK